MSSKIWTKSPLNTQNTPISTTIYQQKHQNSKLIQVIFLGNPIEILWLPRRLAVETSLNPRQGMASRSTTLQTEGLSQLKSAGPRRSAARLDEQLFHGYIWYL